MYLSILETGADREIFQKLYEENRQKLYFIAWKILHNANDAEDAVHTCFLKLVEKFSDYRYLPYLELVKLSKTIVKNAAADIAREYEKKGSFSNEESYGENDVADSSKDISEQLIKRYERELVSRAVMQLTEEERNFLHLQYGLGLKPKDIGALLGMSSETVRRKMLRCRNRLAKILKDEGYDDFQ